MRAARSAAMRWRACSAVAEVLGLAVPALAAPPELRARVIDARERGGVPLARRRRRRRAVACVGAAPCRARPAGSRRARSPLGLRRRRARARTGRLDRRPRVISASVAPAPRWQARARPGRVAARDRHAGRARVQPPAGGARGQDLRGVDRARRPGAADRRALRRDLRGRRDASRCRICAARAAVLVTAERLGGATRADDGAAR